MLSPDKEIQDLSEGLAYRVEEGSLDIGCPCSLCKAFVAVRPKPVEQACIHGMGRDGDTSMSCIRRAEEQKCCILCSLEGFPKPLYRQTVQLCFCLSGSPTGLSRIQGTKNLRWSVADVVRSKICSWVCLPKLGESFRLSTKNHGHKLFDMPVVEFQ